ncbi:PhzF family phenazine biosynthesis protein [Arenicella xantha]|uniref:Trans-2,3-dihydro-3-hydroxyanthranilate isomerase n=1 Tax=Arenicella xantha TaxID=644221 RepID=A0A395JGF7_9GAMM|nr:PhzF family phenazine biosynthesis protein [Arenicella xantha]RBP48872.1 trans-2,3-dihydro-3-hydroxyanthranilate isomerase [Arenicella xantha]
MNYTYYICDVFTTKRFSGNQLAVFPSADGLTDKQMQSIAREFNFSESTFVFSPSKDNTRKVRIFTPSIEVPFAGHPNIGTAFVLAVTGEIEEFESSTEITFEEKAGLVPIVIRKQDHQIWCEFRAPEKLSFGELVTTNSMAAVLSLKENEIVTSTHYPQVASVGLPFLIVELRDRAALARAKINLRKLEKLAERGVTPDIHVYIKSDDEFDIRARMFAPLDGVPEDPATGSANCALAALLAHHDSSNSSILEWRIAQGCEMGRPSILNARTEKIAGKGTFTYIGGESVMVSQGTLYCG